MGNYTNATLMTEEYRHLDTAIKEAAKTPTYADKIFTSPLVLNNIGKSQYTYYAETDRSDAVVSMTIEDVLDLTNVAATSVDIVVVQASFFMGRRQLEASRGSGTPLDARSARSAVYKVKKKRDEVLLNGWSRDGTNYDVSGLYQSANNTYSTSKDFATAGNPIAASQGARALLSADNIMGPYDLFLNTTQYNELVGSVHTGGTNELEFIKANILDGGNVYEVTNSTILAAGKGMMIAKPGDNTFQLIQGKSLATEYYDREGLGTLGRVLETVGIAVYDTNSICTLTAI